MGFKLNLLLEVNGGIKTAANKLVFSPDAKGNSIRRSCPSSARDESPTLTSCAQLDVYQGGFCLAESGLSVSLLPGSSLKHVNIKRG